MTDILLALINFALCVAEPWAYPDAALPVFKRWFRHEYLPTKYPKYILTKSHLLGGQQNAMQIAELYKPKEIEGKW